MARRAVSGPVAILKPFFTPPSMMRSPKRNRLPYGLAAYALLLPRSLETAQRIGAELEAGMVFDQSPWFSACRKNPVRRRPKTAAMARKAVRKRWRAYLNVKLIQSGLRLRAGFCGRLTSQYCAPSKDQRDQAKPGNKGEQGGPAGRSIHRYGAG